MTPPVRLILAPDVVRDLSDIHAHIERASPASAPAVVERILAAARRLPEMPTASAIVPEFDDPTLRQVRVYDYRIIYRLLQDAIRVLMVVHGARDIGPELQRRL